jgi:hypothetical protein
MSADPLLPFLRQLPATPTHCPDDGFPLVEIDGEHYCSVEYADALLGGQQVVGVADALPGGAQPFVELLLASGYALPLTCPCCGGALHLTQSARTLSELRALLLGRTLEGFRHGEWVGSGQPPERHPVFALQFSGAEARSERTLEVSLESVRRIRKTELA